MCVVLWKQERSSCDRVGSTRESVASLLRPSGLGVGSRLRGGPGRRQQRLPGVVWGWLPTAAGPVGPGGLAPLLPCAPVSRAGPLRTGSSKVSSARGLFALNLVLPSLPGTRQAGGQSVVTGHERPPGRVALWTARLPSCGAGGSASSWGVWPLPSAVGAPGGEPAAACTPAELPEARSLLC